MEVSLKAGAIGKVALCLNDFSQNNSTSTNSRGGTRQVLFLVMTIHQPCSSQITYSKVTGILNPSYYLLTCMYSKTSGLSISSSHLNGSGPGDTLLTLGGSLSLLAREKLRSLTFLPRELNKCLLALLILRLLAFPGMARLRLSALSLFSSLWGFGWRSIAPSKTYT